MKMIRVMLHLSQYHIIIPLNKEILGEKLDSDGAADIFWTGTVGNYDEFNRGNVGNCNCCFPSCYRCC